MADQETNQNGAPQQGDQPQSNQQGYQQAPQVIYIQQPVQPAFQPVAASQAEKEALFSTTGSIWMLIASIVFTLNLVGAIVSNLLSGIVNSILLLLMAIGFWLVFANGRKKTLNTTGIQLIRVPYIIQFVFTVLGFVGNIVIWIFTFNIFSMLAGIVSFIFQCICYASVKKTLDMGWRINQNKSVAGMKAGVFAAVIMIISAVFTLINDIADYLFVKTITDAIAEGAESISPQIANLVKTLLGGGGVMTIVAAVIAFIASISVAIVLLQFGKKIRNIYDR